MDSFTGLPVWLPSCPEVRTLLGWVFFLSNVRNTQCFYLMKKLKLPSDIRDNNALFIIHDPSSSRPNPFPVERAKTTTSQLATKLSHSHQEKGSTKSWTPLTLRSQRTRLSWLCCLCKTSCRVQDGDSSVSRVTAARVCPLQVRRARQGADGATRCKLGRFGGNIKAG